MLFPLNHIACILGDYTSNDTSITGFQQDNRLIVPGNLFFALKGERVDGHAFLKDVAFRGGMAAVVSKDYIGENFGLFLIKVDDVLGALQNLARNVQMTRNQRIIAVTGSVGKTTTKEFIATLLQEKFKLAKTPGNANSQVSVPLCILNAQGDEEVFVVEMGMSQKGEIERLVNIVPPEMGVVTNVSYAHVAFFPDGLEGIAQAKAEIFSSPKTRLGIMSSQAASFPSVLEKGSFSKIIYGSNDYFWEDKTIVEKGINSPAIHLPFEASHLRENFLAAVVVARALKMPWEDICYQAQKLTMVSKRFETVVRDKVIFINDSYNANATSMIAALQNLPSPQEGKKKIAVLGAMKELGQFTKHCHSQVAECALKRVDHLLCLGEECQVMIDFFRMHNREAELHPTLASIKKRVFEIAESGDVVLLKGSRSNCLWLILDRDD